MINSKKVVIVYGSSGGATETSAQILQEIVQEDLSVDLLDIAKIDINQLLDYDILLLGASTWNWGDLQDDWEDVFEDFKALDLSGKFVGTFGCGDAYLYNDTFCDAVGIIAIAAQEAGATLIGSITKDGYSFDESKAERDGLLLGVLLDQDNEPELTEARLRAWYKKIKQDLE